MTVIEKGAAAILVEIFKKSFKGFIVTGKWLALKGNEHDIFGKAAKQYTRKFEERFGQIRIIGMDKPVPLRNMFVSVRLLRKLSSEYNTSISELEKQRTAEKELISIKDIRIRIQQNKWTREGFTVVDKLDKFIVLGKPGAGKTTFLKFTGLRSLDGKTLRKKYQFSLV